MRTHGSNAAIGTVRDTVLSAVNAVIPRNIIGIPRSAHAPRSQLRVRGRFLLLLFSRSSLFFFFFSFLFFFSQAAIIVTHPEKFECKRLEKRQTGRRNSFSRGGSIRERARGKSLRGTGHTNTLPRPKLTVVHACYIGDPCVRDRMRRAAEIFLPRG